MQDTGSTPGLSQRLTATELAIVLYLPSATVMGSVALSSPYCRLSCPFLLPHQVGNTLQLIHLAVLLRA